MINQETILNWLTYNPKEPLLFTELYFWVFFGLVLTVFSFIHKNKALRNAFLFFVSLFFYYKTSGFYYIILLFSTVTDYFIGFRIYDAKKQWAKQSWVAVSVMVNLFVLGYFKYAYFFVDSINDAFGTTFTVSNQFAALTNGIFGTGFTVDKILLPVGISFFTFQTMSYAIDIYRGHIKPVKSILDFGFYVSFFPQLVAGPIVRAADFIPQLYKPYRLTRNQFGLAVFWILNGLVKKVFLADYLASNFMDRVFSNPGSYSGFENMMALVGYSLQVYADFSGYTDIAIGVALLMGFRLPTNFNSPYKATSVGNFWKRWHISLSSWLKDYLYIPMGGNRGGSVFSFTTLFVILAFISLLSGSWKVPVFLAVGVGLVLLITKFSTTFKEWLVTNINLMLTMLIGGLWHGASWNFVVWGGLNGLGLVVYKLWNKVSPWKNKRLWFNRVWGIALTFIFITFTRTYFRNESFENASIMLHQIGFSFQPELVWPVLVAYKNVFWVMLVGYIIHWLPVKTKSWYRIQFIKSPTWVKPIAATVVAFIIYQVLMADMQPFIYFAF